ncbi:MAG: hypothetical protein BWK78_01275 [Thiotrichaceae bacterium IS1]|nr:MAG: hypothetical protein BWK78_01275 [Thiotrichaceae bacterium IS1]
MSDQSERMNMNTSHPLLSIVDTQAYAQSPAFLGYYEASSRQWKHEASEQFFDFFQNQLNDCTLFCSVTQNVVTEPFFTEAAQQSLRHLTARGWLELDKADEEIQRNFHIHPLTTKDTSLLRSLCELVIEGYTYGHVFLFWTKEKLVLYPHDDVGFGVLAPPRTTGELIGVEFLNQVKANGKFEVDIRRRVSQRAVGESVFRPQTAFGNV